MDAYGRYLGGAEIGARVSQAHRLCRCFRHGNHCLWNISSVSFCAAQPFWAGGQGYHIYCCGYGFGRSIPSASDQFCASKRDGAGRNCIDYHLSAGAAPFPGADGQRQDQGTVCGGDLW